MALNSEQVLLITAEVKKAGLIIADLQSELIDHICCQTEEVMSGGMQFSEAFAAVKKQFSLADLQAVEKNTKILIDKNYVLMNNLMKISGNISLSLIALGTIMKIYSMYGANILLVPGFIILGLVFIPSVFYNVKGKNTNVKSLLFKITSLTGIVAFAFGILFRVMNWFYWDALLIIAYTLILLSLPILYYNVMKSNIDKKNKSINLFCVFSLFSFITAIMFKMFMLPGASILLILSSVMLISISLPIYTYAEFKKTGMISGRLVFLVIFSFYLVTMSLLMSYNISLEITNVVSSIK